METPKVSPCLRLQFEKSQGVCQPSSSSFRLLLNLCHSLEDWKQRGRQSRRAALIKVSGFRAPPGARRAHVTEKIIFEEIEMSCGSRTQETQDRAPRADCEQIHRMIRLFIWINSERMLYLLITSSLRMSLSRSADAPLRDLRARVVLVQRYTASGRSSSSYPHVQLG